MREGQNKVETDKLYTLHGEKRAQGKLSIINGHKALAYFQGQNIVGYTTLDEMNKEFYTRDLPEYNLDF